MRDIWGTRLSEGEPLELWYISRTDGQGREIFEIFPVSGCVEAEDGRLDLADIVKTYGDAGIVPEAVANQDITPILRYRLGRVWAKPLHAGFQRTKAVNIVGADADPDAPTANFGNISSPPAVYKNIEVELCPNKLI